MSQTQGVVRFIRNVAGTCSNAPDAELVERFALSGDEQAFRSLVARYGPTVWAVCRKQLRNHHDAEDAFQATLLVFARKARSLRAGAAVGSWLYAVAHRTAARVRSTRHAEQTDAEPVDASPGTLEAMTVREAEAALHDELARLPEKYRAPLLLCCLDGLSRDEAASRLAWSVNRVKHSLERGRELLRKRLARRGIALGLPLLANLLATPASAAPPAVVEASVSYATGAAPPVALSSLVIGVTRTMWIAKWKWALAGCLALTLTASGTFAMLPGDSPQEALPVAKPQSISAPLAAPDAKKEPPKPAWDVATAYLRFISEGKGEEAQKLGDKLDDRFIRELTTAATTGKLKDVKHAMILINDSRVMVVTQRTWLKRRPTAVETQEHATVTLVRKDAISPWRVRSSDVADENAVWREVDEYLEGKFAFPPNEKPNEEPARPKETWDLAHEFLKLAVIGKTTDALKLTVPGTISENSVGEIKEIGVRVTTPVVVLLNDTRIEVAFQQQKIKDGDRPEKAGHVVLMLTKSKDGAWAVKDVDFRDKDKLEPRVKLYLGGRYNEPAK